MKNFQAEKFQQAIVDWFRAHARDLPWRESEDPYAIWVSEVMLQQTTVATVIPYFERFIKRFPNVKALANAQVSEVIKLWEGLGYYSRARNLHRGAQVVLAEFKGELPKSRSELLKIPGVGPYTAGAILSIGHGISSPALDGNLIRVYARVFALKEFVNRPSTLKILWQYAEEMTPSRAEWARSFTEGMMELGATVCRPKAPFCLLCPVKKFCAAFHLGLAGELPRKEALRKREVLFEQIYLIRRGERIAFFKEGADSRYPHFLRLPFERVSPFSGRADFEYPITYRVHKVRLAQKRALPRAMKKSDVQWVSVEDLERISLPAIDRRILKSCLMK